ncbi:ATP-binding cassette domain-containing protein [uncultured Cohaesibacter sp.]|uniref:ATP-binding cassette domain-containing protein n=1 Tax=uncultured Cohaesibacter sp. TaxID=1002546 RepID=UPI00292CF20B|nr:ATP-binding cassette domain-containing protein [uncultured Cohaesibacter sp.]
MPEADTSKAGLQLEEINIKLAGHALIDLSLSVSPGEIVTIMGPSGSGKSSLLAYLCGFLAPDFRAGGRILLNGKDITSLPPEQRHLGILFQDPLLFPHLSVAGNLAFGLSADCKGRQKRAQTIAGALADINMDGFEARDPATLSGGQKARVALARVLLSEPKALLLDEPFSKLDADLRAQIRSHVFGRARQKGLPTLLVTHDEMDAEAAGGRIIRLDPCGL